MNITDYIGLLMGKYCFNEEGGVDVSDDLMELVVLKIAKGDIGDTADVENVAEKAYFLGQRNTRYQRIQMPARSHLYGSDTVLWMEGNTREVLKSVTDVLDKHGITAK